MPYEAVQEFVAMAMKVATQGHRQGVLEHFKGHFCAAIGTTHVRSSSESWAETDLANYMRTSADSAPLFIEAFFDACEALRKGHPDWVVPDATAINHILVKHRMSE